MKRESLDKYDIRPEEMTNYLQYYGWHFNKKMCDFAVNKLMKKGRKLDILSKEKVDEILKTYKINLENNQLYDYVYVANMGKAFFFESSIISDLHFAKFIKDYIDGENSYDGMPFVRWYSDMCRTGYAIDWEEML